MFTRAQTCIVDFENVFFPYLYREKLRKNDLNVPSTKKSGSDLIKIWIIERINEEKMKASC